MADTLGSLVDKLFTVDMKMWNNQELLYEIRRMSLDEFKAKYADNLDDLYETLKKCCDLNVQRATLVHEIDRLFKDAIEGTVAPQANDPHKTY